jgi:DNA replication protein DnaC
MHEKIKDLLKALGFKGMLRYFEETLDLKKTDETWPKIFCSLLEQEKAYRQTRSFAYRLSLSKMPQIRSLDNFDITGLPIKHDVFEKTKDMQFIDDHQNILIVGGTGSGKSHLALGFAHKALQEKYRVRFFKFSDLARKLIQAKTHNYEDKFMRRLLRFNLLVIDEFGYLPVDPAASPLLFELFSNLYENVSVILTTHLVFEEWADIFENKKSTKAIIDRFTHHCLVLETGNKSWRLQGKNTQEKNK